MASAAPGGDPAGIDRMSSGYGARSADMHSQSRAFGGALDAMPATRFAGGRADRTRDFAHQMRAASARAARAYDVVARFLPQVSRAAQDTNEAHMAAIKAKHGLTAAKAANVKAEADLAAAEANLVGPTLLAGPAGPSPVLLHARDAARSRAEVTRRELAEAQRAFSRAQRRFDDAEEHRQSVLKAFTLLCQSAAVDVNGALPMPPEPVGALGPTLGLRIVTAREMLLRNEAATLLRIPQLASTTGTASLRRVQALIRNQQWASINELTPVVAPHQQATVRALPKKSLLDRVYHLPVLHGFLDAAKGTATGAWGLLDAASKATDFTQPGVMVKEWKRIADNVATVTSNPGETVKALVGLDQLQHDPLNWLGGGAFSALTSGGASRLAKLSKDAEAGSLAAKAHYDKVRGLVDSYDSPSHLDQLALHAAKARADDAARRADSIKNFDRMAKGYTTGTSMSGWTDFFAQQAEAERQQQDGVTGPVAGSGAGALEKHVSNTPKGHVSVAGHVHR